MKITMYELLGMIKDGKAPKKVKMIDYIYEYQGDDYLYKDEDKKEYWLFSAGYTNKFEWLDSFLNTEVEIIEEEKKIPEKLDNLKLLDEDMDYKVVIAHQRDNNWKINQKINSIIDYLKSKGE